MKTKEKQNNQYIVDLGLPSGTLWAKCNVGASSETDDGLYFQWDSLEQRLIPQMTGEFVGRVPSKEQFKELIKYTNLYPTTINGVDGYQFVSKKDESKYIFFPASGGFKDDDSVFGKGVCCEYWASSLFVPEHGCVLRCYWHLASIGGRIRNYRLPVRMVLAQ